MSASLTGTGLTTEDLAAILANVQGDMLSSFPLANVTSASVIGNLIAQMATELKETQDLIAAVYNSMDINYATGSSLDARGSLVGVTRETATKAIVTLTVNLDATTTLPAGSVARMGATPANRFVTTIDVTSTTAGNYTVTAEAETAGTLVVPVSSVNEIAVPVTGWNSVTNAAAGTSGTSLESDSTYRQRIRTDVSQTGKSNVDSVLRTVQAVSGLTSASILENTTDLTDGNGLPPHSIELIVIEGTATDNEIAQAIGGVKAAGIETYSASADSGTFTSAVTGATYTINFTKATTSSTTITATYTYLSDLYPGDDAIEDAITEYFSSLGPGQDVIYNKVIGVIYEAGEGSIVDISSLSIGGSASNKSIGQRVRATLGTVTLTSSAGAHP